MIIQNNLREPHYAPENIATWYLYGLESGDYRIRVRLMRENGGYFEKVNVVRVEQQNYDMLPTAPEIDEVYLFNHGSLTAPEGTLVETEDGELFFWDDNSIYNY